LLFQDEFNFSSTFKPTTLPQKTEELKKRERENQGKELRDMLKNRH